MRRSEREEKWRPISPNTDRRWHRKGIGLMRTKAFCWTRA